MKRILYIFLCFLMFDHFAYGQTAQTDSVTDLSYQTVRLWGTYNQGGNRRIRPAMQWTTNTETLADMQEQVCSPSQSSPPYNTDFVSSVVIDGQGEPFLSTNTTYYYRACIYNDTSEWKSFTTLDYSAPVVLTVGETEVGNSSATVGGDVTSDGGKAITQRGICYNTTGNPTTDDNTETTVGTTGAFEITLQSLNPNTTYYFKAYAINSEGTGYGDEDNFTTTGITEWTGSTSTSWGSGDNWTDGVPSLNINAEIPSSVASGRWPTISTGALTKDLTIKAGGILTVSSGNSLTVYGDFLMESSASASPTQFVINGTGTLSVSGSSSIELYVGASNWRYVSPPVSSANITVFSNYFVNSYNEPNAEWDNLNLGDNLVAGIGYSVKNSSGSSKITFSGVPNTGSQSTSITNSNVGNDDYGWNLIGNPYPSAIDLEASSGWNISNCDNTVYYYDMENSVYATYNFSTSASTNGGTRYIPPMQGFFVHANASSGSFGMNNNVRVANQQDFWKKEAVPEFENAIKLIAENGDLSDEIIIGFDPNTTEGFDSEYDAYKLFSAHLDLPQIYTKTSNSDLAVNIQPLAKNTMSFNIGFYVGNTGTFSLRATGIESFPDDTKIFLEDLEENIITDLSTSNYEFSSSPAYTTDRFAVHIQLSGTDIAENLADNNYHIYSHRNAIYVQSNQYKRNSYIAVYDVLGKEIYKESLNRHNFYKIENNFNPGTYIVKIHSNKNILSKKIVLE